MLISGRFIPAYAGNAPSIHCRARDQTVHPRIRGERGANLGEPHAQGGSSPHTRGTHDHFLVSFVAGRFIPAYAGNAPGSRPAPDPLTVHPRIRGERIVALLVLAACAGSSPHTRGTLRGRLVAMACPRFIPAYAGNARSPRSVETPRAVHPRIRGERNDPIEPDAGRYGSSPHTRGTRGTGARWAAVPWFIPAYAGNARLGPSPWQGRTVHPRIRGERSASARASAPVSGSSPHTRGTHFQ